MPQKYRTIEDEFKKSKLLKRSDIEILQDWMQKQPHLPQIDELKIIGFLHACYYKIEATKACIDKFYGIRGHWTEFSLNRDVFSFDLHQAMKYTLLTILPIHTKQNYQVLFMRFMESDASAYHYLQYLKLFDTISMLWYKIHGISDGVILLVDMEGFSLTHALKSSPVLMKKYIYYLQEALPVRLKAIRIINVSAVTDKMLSIAKPFMNKGLLSMLYTHPNFETIYDHIPKEAFPNEYGGRSGTFRELHENMKCLLEENAEYLLDDGNEIANESKRLQKLKNLDNIFGIEGTFKKLEID